MSDTEKDLIDEHKNIEIVPGEGLDISPVYEHLEIEKPTNMDHSKKNIIIPEEKKDKK